jgi:hypothetical protein
MGTKLLIIKQRLDQLLLAEQLAKTAESVVEKNAKDLEWLHYAEEKDGIYKFLPDVEERWGVLKEIAKEVHTQTNFPMKDIAEVLSYLVNTRVIDEIKRHNLKLKDEILDMHNKYLMSILLEPKVVETHIPGYYWLKISKKLNCNRCEVLDFSEATKHIFSRRITKDYIFYEQLQN